MDIPNALVFQCLQSLNFEQLLTLMREQGSAALRPILPCLARMYFCQSLDTSTKWVESRRKMLELLVPFQSVNEMHALMSIDYGAIEADVKREMAYRMKGATFEGSGFLATLVMPDGVFYYFERTDDPRDKLKIVLNELIGLMAHVRNYSHALNQPNSSPYQSDLLDDKCNVEEVVFLIYMAISEMPSAFQLFDIVEALLALKEGFRLICRLVANFPDSFHEVCSSLIGNCEKGDEDQHGGGGFYSANRVQVLRGLCRMNKTEALLIRAEAVEQCRMANLVVMLTLDHIGQIGPNEPEKMETADEDNKDCLRLTEERIRRLQSKSDVIAFLLGILMSNDDRVRTWFSQYIKPPKEKHHHGHPPVQPHHSHSTAIFNELRWALLVHFRSITEAVEALQREYGGRIDESQAKLLLTQACLMLRLYCALRGVAAMKFSEMETTEIGRLIICRPPHNVSGVRFVTFGLCMILAFPQLVTMGSSDREAAMIDWIKWLVQEESYFGKSSKLHSSFGEMLLLIAIHFHSNQLAAIGELISSIIGIKLPIQTNELNRIKHIFTQDIFTDQTVTAHAIKVPVTRSLNSAISGFLSVHCIYQLIKSRAFTKHRVPIKDWILKQIRQSVSPIHPILPLLIEAYVNSILVPNVQSGLVLSNEPLTEAEVRAVFEKKVYSIEGHVEEVDEDEEEDEEEDATDEEDEKTDEEEDEKMQVDGEKKDEAMACELTSQLLVLYYVLLYEDVRIAANRKNQGGVSTSSGLNSLSALSIERKAFTYSADLFEQLPIFYLVQRTRVLQREYGVLMPPLLRLLAFHYPHLCLVKDWLPLHHSTELIVPMRSTPDRKISTQFERTRFNRAFEISKDANGGTTVNYYRMTRACDALLKLPDEHLWPLVEDYIAKVPLLLEEQVPKILAINMRNVWFRLNRIFPTKLWLQTVNCLGQDCHKVGKHFVLTSTWEDMMRDPMIVLRLDKRVFRTPELMEIVLHMLNGFLSASKIYREHYSVEHPIRLAAGSVAGERLELEKRRESDRAQYQALSDGLAIQILLECCLLKESDFEGTKRCVPVGCAEDNEDYDTSSSSAAGMDDSALILRRRRSTNAQRFTGSGSRVGEGNFLSNLHEVQGLICNHIHQCFIADPNAAKLVHFHGYYREVLPLVVAGVPSMHICADFIPELLEPNKKLETHSFAIDLTSHLCVQYPIARFLSLAELCLAVIELHLAILPSEKRANFHLSILPAMERMGQVFPPLIEPIVNILVLLMQKNGYTLSGKLKVEDPFHWMPEAVQLRDPRTLEKDDDEARSLGKVNDEDFEQLVSTNLIDLEWSTFEKLMRRRKLAPEQAVLITSHKVFGMLCRHHSTEKIFSDKSFDI